MATFKPEVAISQLVDKIGMTFHRLDLCFLVQLFNGTIKNVVLPNRKRYIQNDVLQTGSIRISP